MNPYTILGVSPASSDEEIRRAYLQGIKANPPDKLPQAFQKISDAYSKIKDEESRIHHALFNREAPGESPLTTVISAQKARGIRPLPSDQFQSFLRTCAKI